MEKTKKRRVRKAGWILPRAVRDCCVTALLLAAAVLLSELLRRMNVGPQDSLALYLLAIFIIAATTDRYWYSIAASFGGVLLYDVLITYPRFNLSITKGFPVTFCLMLVVALTTSAVTNRIKLRAKKAAEKEHRAELMYRMNRGLLSSRTMDGLVENALDYLERYLGCPVLYYGKTDQEEEGAPAGWVAGKDTAKAKANCGWCSGKAKKIVETQHPELGRTPEGDWVYFSPVLALGQVQGVFAVFCAEQPPGEQEKNYITMLSEQAAQAMQLQILDARQKAAQVLVETEKARNSFLRAISHDLRTPMTTILGASSVLLDSGDELEDETKYNLIRGIYDDCGWLLTMVENLLAVTRIHNADMTVTKHTEVVEEIVAGATAAVRKRFPGTEILLSMPDEPLMVPMDGILISQVLTNLLDNALRHGQRSDARQVWINVRREREMVEFSVLDDGKGISEQAMSRLFEMHSSEGLRGEDASRGLGMGLSICKTIVEAHGGSIAGANRPMGGAEFRFSLPLEE